MALCWMLGAWSCYTMFLTHKIKDEGHGIEGKNLRRVFAGVLAGA